MGGIMIVIGLGLAVVIMTAAIRAPQQGLRVAAGILSLVVLGVCFMLSSVRYVGESQVGIIGLTGSVHTAPHHRDGDFVFFGEFGHFTHILRQIHKFCIFDPGTTGAGDDIQPF